MAKISAAEFDLLCDAVAWACDSLSSCVGHEAHRESERVYRAAEELAVATLKRRNPVLEAYRASVLRRASNQLTVREAASLLSIRPLNAA